MSDKPITGEPVGTITDNRGDVSNLQRLTAAWQARALLAEAELAKVKEHLSTYYRAAVLEEAAKACEKRAERRFEEHGTTEPDTNASYYTGRYKELGDCLDEEDNDCAAAIRALAEKGKP